MRTNAGIDFQCGVMGSTSSNGTGAYAAANYIALTANSTTPSATDTTLAGEVSSGTLARTQGTYAHTTGVTSYSISHTFTSDQSITINKFGIFNASSAGTMVFETLVSSPQALVSGDQIVIVDTVDI